MFQYLTALQRQGSDYDVRIVFYWTRKKDIGIARDSFINSTLYEISDLLVQTFLSYKFFLQTEIILP